jgi:hypothetical protein
MNDWIPTTASKPTDSHLVETKAVVLGVDTHVTKLRWENAEWVTPNRKGSVTWVPTHWRAES